VTERERLDDHERRIKRLERDVELGQGQQNMSISGHEQRIDSLERLSRNDLWTGVAIGGYQQALTQVQEVVRDLVRRVEGVEGREVQGLSADDKMVLIGILNDLSHEVDALRLHLAGRAVGDADV
jgi:hypothetical protein